MSSLPRQDDRRKENRKVHMGFSEGRISIGRVKGIPDKVVAT